MFSICSSCDGVGTLQQIDDTVDEPTCLCCGGLGFVPDQDYQEEDSLIRSELLQQQDDFDFLNSLIE